MAAKTKRKQEYLKKQRRKTLIIVLVIIIALGVLYLLGAFLYKDRFFRGSEINGVNVGNMTEAEAIEAVEKTSSDYSITLKFRDEKSETIAGSEIDFHFSTEQIDEALKAQNPMAWIKGYLPSKKSESVAEAEYSAEKLKELVLSLPETDVESMTEPVNAYREYQDGTFVIIPEVMGDTLDPEAAYEAVAKACSETKHEIDLNETKGIYQSPDVYQDDKKLNKEVESLNAIGLGSITYDIPYGDDVVLDAEDWMEWLTEDEDGTFHIDEETWEENLSTYASELASVADTIYRRHKFNTHNGSTVDIEGVGYYGYKVNTEKEVEQIAEDLKSGEAVSRAPIYKKTEAAEPDSNFGFGNTYVEVSLSEQHLWVYQGGSVVVDTDFVSGNDDDKHRTPEGAYFAYDKQQDKIMRGDIQEDGSYGYESHADYWIRLTGEGVGLHDAPWRSDFGGSIWQGNGSHGCINIPASVMPSVYSNVAEGTPVILYY